MQVGQRHKQPHAPHDELYHVLAHHGAALGRRGVFGLKLQAQQRQDGARDPAEEEPQADDDGQLQDAHLQVLLLDELVVEDTPAHVAQVEHVGGPVDADHHRAHNHHGHHHLVDQRIEPGLCDGLLRESMLLLIHLQIVGDAGDGQYAGQLHDPPDEQLH